MGAVASKQLWESVDVMPFEGALRNAIIRAVVSADMVGFTIQNGTEAEIESAEELAFQTKQAMLAEFRELGIGENWLRKLGGVL